MSAFWIFATCLTVAYIIEFEAEKRRNWPSAEKEKITPKNGVSARMEKPCVPPCAAEV